MPKGTGVKRISIVVTSGFREIASSATLVHFLMDPFVCCVSADKSRSFRINLRPVRSGSIGRLEPEGGRAKGRRYRKRKKLAAIDRQTPSATGTIPSGNPYTKPAAVMSRQ